MQTRPGALSRSRSNHRIDPRSSHRLLILLIASSLLCLPVRSSANNAVIDAVHCYIKTGKTTKAEELISRIPAGYSAEALYRDHETLIDLIHCYLDAGLHD